MTAPHLKLEYMQFSHAASRMPDRCAGLAKVIDYCYTADAGILNRPSATSVRRARFSATVIVEITKSPVRIKPSAQTSYIEARSISSLSCRINRTPTTQGIQNLSTMQRTDLRCRSVSVGSASSSVVTIIARVYRTGSSSVLHKLTAVLSKQAWFVQTKLFSTLLEQIQLYEG